MDSAHAAPLQLAVRLRRAKLDDRATALFAGAVTEELGVELLRERDAIAAGRLTELTATAARRAAAALWTRSPSKSSLRSARHPSYVPR